MDCPLAVVSAAAWLPLFAVPVRALAVPLPGVAQAPKPPSKPSPMYVPAGSGVLVAVGGAGVLVGVRVGPPGVTVGMAVGGGGAWPLTKRGRMLAVRCWCLASG